MTGRVVEETVGFWAGLIVGIICGTFVVGIALIGQDGWEAGKHWGYEQCKLEVSK